MFIFIFKIKVIKISVSIGTYLELMKSAMFQKLLKPLRHQNIIIDINKNFSLDHKLICAIILYVGGTVSVFVSLERKKNDK